MAVHTYHASSLLHHWSINHVSIMYHCCHYLLFVRISVPVLLIAHTNSEMDKCGQTAVRVLLGSSVTHCITT